jgi:hypothetical protein
MTVERALRAIAGFFVAASVLLSVFHSAYWLFFTGFVGLNLFQSGFTNWCPMIWILEKAGLKREADSGDAQPA